MPNDLFDEICRGRYRHDAALLPTFIGPLARAANYRAVDLAAAEREERKKQFSNFRDGFKFVKQILCSESIQSATCGVAASKSF